MARARALYQRTVELARRQSLGQVALGYAAQAAWTEAVYGNRREALRRRATCCGGSRATRRGCGPPRRWRSPAPPKRPSA